MARMLPGAKVLEEARQIVRSAFAADTVAFLPNDFGDDLTTVGEVAADVHATICDMAREVRDSGLMTKEATSIPHPAVWIALPVTVRGRGEAVMVVGYDGVDEPPHLLLEAMLGVAALVSSALERQLTDLELREAANNRRRILDAVGDGICSVDAAGIFTFANTAALDILGCKEQQLIGVPAAGLVVENDSGADAVPGADKVRREVVLRRRDGSTFPAELVWVPIVSKGHAADLVATFADISERKAKEAQLRRLTDDLAARLRENEDLVARVREEVKAREVAQARAAHAERLQALGQLAGGIAHDFNNILQALNGAISLIERRSDNEASVRRLARLAGEAVGRGASITRRLLAFGRRGDLRAEPLDVTALLCGLREILTHTLGAGVEVHVSSEGGLEQIFADKAQLETALINLATNARDAMPEGGRLTLCTQTEIVSSDGPAHLAGLAPGRYLRLAVADTGTGMDAATLAHATEPFFTTKELGVGTGLGLPMAKGFAEQSCGALNIESSPGQGTTVTLWLPEPVSRTSARAAAPNAVTDLAAPGMDERTFGARLMVVDDEPFVRDVLAEQLKDAGFGVLVAADGAEALAQLDAGEAVDALISDLSMPGMDGVAVIRAAQERCPGLPSVLLTGYSGDGIALAMGATVSDRFMLLRKPIHIQDLVDRVQSMLAAKAKCAG
jgi:PAS domain S-box-containing protein